jgi:hypothetical protein
MGPIDKYIVRFTATIGETAAAINREKTSFAMVVDAEGRLIGTVTDGDLRRAYLAARDLSSPISLIMCTRPVTVQLGTDEKLVEDMARRHRIEQIPVLDEKGKPCDIVHVFNDEDNLAHYFRTAVVMAGGEGRRLRPFTENIPKPMLEVNGRPILEHILDGLIAAGVRRVYFSVNYRADIIIDHFGDGSHFGIAIDYLRETTKLGTAGSLSLLPALADEPLLVMNGDVMTKLDYRSFYAFIESIGG